MSEVPATKKCPFCGEEILQEAIKCKHCGSDLVSKPKQNPPGTAIAGIGLGLAVVGFVLAYLLGGTDADSISGICSTIGGIGLALLVIGLLMRVFAPKSS